MPSCKRRFPSCVLCFLVFRCLLQIVALLFFKFLADVFYFFPHMLGAVTRFGRYFVVFPLFSAFSKHRKLRIKMEMNQSRTSQWNLLQRNCEARDWLMMRLVIVGVLVEAKHPILKDYRSVSLQSYLVCFIITIVSLLMVDAAFTFFTNEKSKVAFQRVNSILMRNKLVSR